MLKALIIQDARAKESRVPTTRAAGGCFVEPAKDSALSMQKMAANQPIISESD